MNPSPPIRRSGARNLGTKRLVRLACWVRTDASQSVGPVSQVGALSVTMTWSAANTEGVARSARPISPAYGPVRRGLRAMRRAGHATVAFSRVGLFNALGWIACPIGLYPLPVLAQELEDALVGTRNKSAPSSSRRSCQRRSCIPTRVVTGRATRRTTTLIPGRPLLQRAALLRHA
jgi:hypothetical protein